MSKNQPYEFLKQQFAHITNLRGAMEILSRDSETVMAMGSENDRISQTSAIAAAMNAFIADPKVEEALLAAKELELSPLDRRNLELMHKYWVHEASIPADLAAESARLTSYGEMLHTQKYAGGNFDDVKDHYAQSFKIARELGLIKQEKLGLASAYEAMVDQFTPGLRVADIDVQFEKLSRVLPSLIQEAIERNKSKPSALPFEGPFDIQTQEILNRQVAVDFGFDFNRGVFNFIQGHPSMIGNADDARISARVSSDEIISTIYATIHETGHAVYQQNLPVEWRYQPIGDHLGMAMHESQSMIMEYQAGMSNEYISYMAQRIQTLFNKAGNPAYTPENILSLQAKVSPSFIRVDADEMTYPMHVILRYELEKKLIANELDINDLPDAWNEGMQKLLGITPPSNDKGCMQDIHWPAGLVGYFPAYVYGAMGAAQFFNAATKQKPEIMAELRVGSTDALRTWLKGNVHNVGSIKSYDDVFVDATGSKLDANIYLNHLSQRYVGKPYNPA